MAQAKVIGNQEEAKLFEDNIIDEEKLMQKLADLDKRIERIERLNDDVNVLFEEKRKMEERMSRLEQRLQDEMATLEGRMERIQHER
jgi:polyhydroxyalkanoate synthesis regulator phasin